MNATLKNLKEIFADLHWRHDFDGVQFHSLSVKNMSANEVMEAKRKNIRSIIVPIAKPTVRGSILGGFAGAVIGQVSGQPVGESAFLGTVVGMTAEAKIYLTRTLLRYIDEQFKNTFS